jgi:hypothetical protein
MVGLGRAIVVLVEIYCGRAHKRVTRSVNAATVYFGCVIAKTEQEETMPRLRYIEESEQTPQTRELIESAKRTGAPDPRVVSLMARSRLGIAWVEYWNKVLYQGARTSSRKCVASRFRSRTSAAIARPFAPMSPEPKG